MDIITYLKDLGITPYLVGYDQLMIKKTKIDKEVKKFILNKKCEIIATLRKELPNPDLPADCPFNTGGYCPPKCAFNNRLFFKLLAQGVMQQAKNGCFLKNVCYSKDAEII